MKIKFYLIFGMASALFVWSYHELFLFLTSSFAIPGSAKSSIAGALFGIVFGGLLGGMEGFFSNSPYLFRRGLKFGSLLGFLSGAISFYVIDQIIHEIDFIASNILLVSLFYSLRWLVLGVCIGIAIGLRDRSHLSMIRSIFSGLIAGSVGGIIISFTPVLVSFPFWSRGLGFLAFAMLFTASTYRFFTFQRKTWLKSLNGVLEGLDIELSRDIHIFGTQDNDDINLKAYQDVQQSHAKLIRYFNNYSLVDNDPFCQTFVNFRTIKEQFLKNGDILKIGTALFQYCTVD